MSWRRLVLYPIVIIQIFIACVLTIASSHASPVRLAGKSSPSVTAEQLDRELDLYCGRNPDQEKLDADLDDYWKQQKYGVVSRSFFSSPFAFCFLFCLSVFIFIHISFLFACSHWLPIF